MDAPLNVVAHLLAPCGRVPNHPHWPLLVYPAVIGAQCDDPAARFEELFARNQWPPAWRNGVYGIHHYHSNCHEALGIYSGEVTVQFGGDLGVQLTARAGDVIVLPAGTGHRKVGSRGTLGIVGAYPAGCSPDMCVAAVSDPRGASRRIAAVPLPAADPVHGRAGPLFTRWRVD